MKGSIKAKEEKVLEVLECNLWAYEIFKRCKLMFVGMSGYCNGLDPSNIRSVMRMFNPSLPKELPAYEYLPRNAFDRLCLFDDVWFLGETTAELINSKAKSRKGS